MATLDYIADLLYDNDCVIVPGLGAFVSNYKPATLNGGVYVVFTPPSKSVLFNSKINHNDGLLVDYTAFHENLSYKVARNQVDTMVSHLKRALKAGEKIDIKGVGVLSLNVAKQIEFEPSYDSNLLSDSYGLPSFSVYALNPDSARRRASFQSRPSVRRLAYRKYARVALFATPVVLFLALLPSLYFNGIQQSSLVAFFKQNGNNNNAVVADSGRTTQASLSRALDTLTSKKSALAYNEPSISYSIVAGCFKSQEAALSLGQTLASSGFKPEVFESNGFYRVSVGTFNDKNLAKGELLRIKTTAPVLAQAWVMKRVN